MKNVNPVVWFEIYVDDLDRAKKFYETVFQLELNEMPMPASADDSMKMLFFRPIWNPRTVPPEPWSKWMDLKLATTVQLSIS